MAILDILVVAPDHPDLPNVAAEVAAIAQQHRVVALTGVVRDQDIAAAVQNGPYAAVWWATHGTADGVLLSDGLLDIAGVGQYLRAAEAELGVLNTCDSEQVALAMVAASDAAMICTIGPVKDGDAQRFGMLLARSLAEHDDYRAAYEQVAPTGGKYRYVTASYRSLHRPAEASGYGLRVAHLEERLVSLEKTQSNISWALILVALMFAAQTIWIIQSQNTALREISDKLADTNRRIVRIEAFWSASERYGGGYGTPTAPGPEQP